MKSRFLTGVKYFFQFGIRPLALYGLYKFGLLTGHYKRVTPAIPNSLIPNSSSLFSLPAREQLTQILGEEGKAILLNETDEIMNGNIRVFGELTALNFKLNLPLQHWTAYESNAALLSSFTYLHKYYSIPFFNKRAIVDFTDPTGP